MFYLLLLLAVAAMPDTSFGYDEGPTIVLLFCNVIESSPVRLRFSRYLKQYLKLLAYIRGYRVRILADMRSTFTSIFYSYSHSFQAKTSIAETSNYAATPRLHNFPINHSVIISFDAV